MPVAKKPASLQPGIRLPEVRLKRFRSDLIADSSYLADISSSSNSSSEEDEAVEVKRRKLDPDYQPSTASESPLTTAVSSQNVSEEEELTESNSEDTESWQPSGTTSSEIISSSEEN
jgi:hypothetical protein